MAAEEPESTVTFDITADVLSTNGVVDITWDADDLELVNVVSNADYSSKLVNDESVVFGYVSIDGIKAGEAIATLTFNALSNDQSSFHVEYRELNSGIVEEPVTVIDSGWSGYTLWELTSDGVLTISPSGSVYKGECNMKHYWSVNGVLTLPWSDYLDQITKIVVEDGVNGIGQMAFFGMPNLKEVVLADSVTKINGYAFKNCAALTDINLENITLIREGAFYACSSLRDVTFNEDVTIEKWAFSRTNVILP